MKKIFLIIISVVFIKCSIEPKPINYGKDMCHYCKMTIVDKVHSAELVTKKGKALKFDAIECMIRHIKNTERSTYELFLINELEIPEVLFDATKSFYLISPNMPSPMGGNLTGFTKEKDANRYKEEKGGNVYNWNEVQKQF